MSKALECLEKTTKVKIKINKTIKAPCELEFEIKDENYEIIKQALIKAQEQEKALEILAKGYFSTSYNPKGDYHHITFDIYCEEDYKIIDEWLKDVKKVIIYE